MKARDPIQFSSIIEYYASERVLKRPKDQLINQMNDLITICQFLSNRIPPAMKVIKDSARAQYKNIKDLGTNVRKNLSDILNDPKSNKVFFIESAYDQMSHFNSTKQIVLDYIEKTVAQKQMKLKFLQSENLPNDFIWYKPIKQGREHGNSSKHKDYTWHSYFNTKYNMLQINLRKYRIFVSFKVVNSAYMWTINQIQLKTTQQPSLWLMFYFEEKVVPQLKVKYGQESEVNMLACINNYASYLQILELNKSLCMLLNCPFFSQKITYTHKNQAYEMHFPTAQSFVNPRVTIVYNQFILQLLFSKKQTSASFKIGDLLTLNINEHFKYENCIDLINKFTKLIQMGKKYKKFHAKIISLSEMSDNSNITIADINNHIVYKLNGQTWLQSNLSEHTQQDARELKQIYGTLCKDDLYLAKNIQNKLVYCAINSQGQLTSTKVASPFLLKLLKCAPSVDVLLSFVCIIETVCEQNGLYECQLDYYEVYDKIKGKEKVMLINRKKSVVEDQMIKVTSKGNMNDEQNFNSLKSLVEFNINFTELSFYRFQKDPEQRQKYEKQEWKAMFNLKYKQPTLLNLSEVLEAIRYVQDNTIFKYVVQRKLKNDSKSLYKSLI